MTNAFSKLVSEMKSIEEVIRENYEEGSKGYELSLEIFNLSEQGETYNFLEIFSWFALKKKQAGIEDMDTFERYILERHGAFSPQYGNVVYLKNVKC